jgi:hypothetical protein
MFDSSIEKTIIGTGVFLWFAYGWYLNDRLQQVHKKFDLLFDNLNGLRNYLYEIDPQFNDERESQSLFDQEQQLGELGFAGMNASQLIMKKEAEGRRTLHTPLSGS